MTDSADIRRPLLNIRDPQGGNTLRVDLLHSGQVRLRLNNNPQTDLLCEVLDDVLLDAAASPNISAGVYDQLCWELDMMALHGQ